MPSLVYFMDGNVFSTLVESDDGSYSAGNADGSYSIKNKDEIWIDDSYIVQILDCRVKEYVVLNFAEKGKEPKPVEYKYDSSTVSFADYSFELASDKKTCAYLDVKSDKVAKSISFEYFSDADNAGSIDINPMMKIGAGWEYVKSPDKDVDYPKLATEWKTITTPDFPKKGDAFPAKTGKWFSEDENGNDVLQRVGIEVQSGNGTVYIKNFKVIDQDGNEIDLSEIKWATETY